MGGLGEPLGVNHDDDRLEAGRHHCGDDEILQLGRAATHLAHPKCQTNVVNDLIKLIRDKPRPFSPPAWVFARSVARVAGSEPMFGQSVRPARW